MLTFTLFLCYFKVPQASRSKHLAAADALLLWANTRTFAIPHTYESIESEPVSVMACDLGAPLKRSDLKLIASSTINTRPPPLNGGNSNSNNNNNSNLNDSSMTNSSNLNSSMNNNTSQHHSPVKISDVLTTRDYDSMIKKKEIFLHSKFDISSVPDDLTLIRRKGIQDNNGSIFKGVRRKKGCKNWQVNYHALYFPPNIYPIQFFFFFFFGSLNIY